MKTIRPWPALAAILALCAITCHAQNRFDISETASGTISSEGTTTQIDFPGFDNFSIAKNSSLTGQGVTLGELTSVQIVDFSLLVTTPASGQDLTFLTNVNIYVQAPNQARVLVASRASFDAGNNSQALQTVSGVELVNYFNQDAVTINAEATVKTPSSTVTLEAQPVLQIQTSAAQPVCNG